MSSYTENYNLNQWEASDQVRRVDFNADNAKIDAALTNLSAQVAEKASQSALNSEISARTSLSAQVAKLGNCQIYHTTYVGDGAATQSVTFPKKPLAVFIMGNYSMFRYVTGLGAALSSSYGGTGSNCQITWSGNTMTWAIDSDGYARDFLCNNHGETYYVIALIDAAA